MSAGINIPLTRKRVSPQHLWPAHGQAHLIAKREGRPKEAYGDARYGEGILALQAERLIVWASENVGAPGRAAYISIGIVLGSEGDTIEGVLTGGAGQDFDVTGKRYPRNEPAPFYQKETHAVPPEERRAALGAFLRVLEKCVPIAGRAGQAAFNAVRQLAQTH